jgi:hypothetical protein
MTVWVSGPGDGNGCGTWTGNPAAHQDLLGRGVIGGASPGTGFVRIVTIGWPGRWRAAVNGAVR